MCTLVCACVCGWLIVWKQNSLKTTSSANRLTWSREEWQGGVVEWGERPAIENDKNVVCLGTSDFGVFVCVCTPPWICVNRVGTCRSVCTRGYREGWEKLRMKRMQFLSKNKSNCTACNTDVITLRSSWKIGPVSGAMNRLTPWHRATSTQTKVDNETGTQWLAG